MKKNIYAGWWSDLHKVRHLITGLHKVDAHKARIDAAAEGWEMQWLGNDQADDLAKAARPHVSREHAVWTKWQRARPRALAEGFAAAPPHPWEAMRTAERLPREARQRMAQSSFCHVPRWCGGRWVCRRCGARLGSGRSLETASRAVCPAMFGTSFHASHALSVGIVRESDWDEGFPIAVCRRCGVYSSHKACGLRKACTGHSHGRRSQLKRLASGRHPDARVKMRVDGIVHRKAGCGFQCSSIVGKLMAEGGPDAVEEYHELVNLGGGGCPGAPSDSAPHEVGLEVPADPFTATEQGDDPMAELQELEAAAAAAAATDCMQAENGWPGGPICEDELGPDECDDDAFGHEWADFGPASALAVAGTSSAEPTSETCRGHGGHVADSSVIHYPQSACNVAGALFNAPVLRTQPPSHSQEARPFKRKRVIGKQPDSVPSLVSIGPVRDEEAHVPGAVRSCPVTPGASSGPAAASSTCGPEHTLAGR